MDVKEIANDPSVRNWLDEKAGSNKTRDAYIIGMSAFTEYISITPNDLIQKSRAETKAGLLISERETARYLSRFRKHLEEEEEYAPLTVKTRMTAVFSFYRFHEMPLPDMKKTKRKAHPDPKRSCRITKESIRKILKHADPLERAVVLVGCASGLSQNEIRNLKVADFESGYDAATGVTTLRLVREKTGFPFTTFLTPEATQAVLDYLDYRERACVYTDQHRVDQLRKQRIRRDEKGNPDKNGYLFIRRRIDAAYLLEKTPKAGEKIRQLDERAILDIYKALNVKAETSTPVGEWNELRSHNVRKFFFNTLDGKINSDKLEYMMAHEVSGTKRFYKWDVDVDELKAEYMRHIPFLTIEKSLDVSVAPEYKKLVEEKQKLAAEVERVSVERVELQELKKEIDNLYREIRDTPEGFKLGDRVIRKIHPNRLILLPDNGNEPDGPD